MMRLPAPAEPEPCKEKEIRKLVGFVSKTQLKLLILDSMALGPSPASGTPRRRRALYTTQAARR